MDRFPASFCQSVPDAGAASCGHSFIEMEMVNHQLMSNSNRDTVTTKQEGQEQEQHKDKCRFTRTWLQAQSIIEILGCTSVCTLKACELLLQVTVVISKVTNESLPVRSVWRDTLFWVHVLWNCVTLEFCCEKAHDILLTSWCTSS